MGDPLPATSPSPEKEPVPLVDYVLNVMKFVDAILSNNSTDDHCREFVSQDGLKPLMGILGLPNLPIDFPAQPACQSVGAVCKSILNLAHEPQVLKEGLTHLNNVLKQLDPLHTAVPPPGGSVLLRELVSAPNISEATASSSATPLLHHMAAAHAYIQMFVHVCRTGQAEIRTISVTHWGSELGLAVLAGLSKLYTSLVENLTTDRTWFKQYPAVFLKGQRGFIHPKLSSLCLYVTKVIFIFSRNFNNLKLLSAQEIGQEIAVVCCLFKSTI